MSAANLTTSAATLGGPGVERRAGQFEENPQVTRGRGAIAGHPGSTPSRSYGESLSTFFPHHNTLTSQFAVTAPAWSTT